MNRELQEEIYLKYHDKIVKYFNYQINDYDKAEDLTSEVFLKIWENYDSFDASKSQLSTWIYRICQNYLIDYFRTNNEFYEYIDEISTYDEDDDKLFTNENLERLAEGLLKLSNKERELIINHYYNNVSLLDISRDMGISYIYAKVLHASALKKLKKSIPF